MGKAKHIAFIMYQICLFRFGSYTYFANTHTHTHTHTPRVSSY